MCQQKDTKHCQALDKGMPTLYHSSPCCADARDMVAGNGSRCIMFGRVGSHVRSLFSIIYIYILLHEFLVQMLGILEFPNSVSFNLG